MSDGNTLSDKAAEEIAKTVREVSRRVMNERGHRGRWQFQGGSGGGHTIWFRIDGLLCPEIDYVDESTLVATATWYTGGCNKVPPGANEDGTYNIYDMCNYLFGLVETDLLGTVGRATYHYPLTGTCAPRWIIDDLCAQPEC